MNEDDDELMDEDPTGLVYGNVKETELNLYTEGGVHFGTVSSALDSTITDLQANFTPNGLVGLWIRGNLEFYGLVDQIVWNDATTIKTAGLGDRMEIVMQNGGWPLATAPGRTYMISDLEDSDGDGVVDDWWDYDPSDDDENGFADDLKGWDFTRIHAYPDDLPYGPHLVGDNDSRPDSPAGVGGHGTALAGVLAALANGDGLGIVGVAPAIQVVPIRVYPTNDVDATLATALQYARCLRDSDGNRLVDIVVMATGRSVGAGLSEWDCGTFLEPDGQSGVYADPFAEQLRLAFADGIVVVNGAGNQNAESPDPYFSACFEEAIAVAGVDVLHRPWLDMEGDGTTYGSWVDVAARALNLIVTSQCKEPEHTCHCGLGQIFHGWDCYVDGTSLASPIVGGIAALMLSANPDLGAAELRRKLVSSVDTLWVPPWQEQVRGKLGSGVANAYKALTVWGAVSDTTWRGNVWVSGDIRVPAGTTLTIAAGTTVHLAQDDITAGGEYPRQVEILVEGTLASNGTASEPVRFEPFWECPGSPVWGPMKANPATGGAITLTHTEVTGMVPQLVSPDGGEVVFTGEPLTITWSSGPAAVPCDPPRTLFSTVDIYYSSDDGTAFVPLGQGIANTGSFVWATGLGLATPTARVKVVFHSNVGAGEVQDISAGSFAVATTPGKFVNRSGETDLDYTGTPSNAVGFDYNRDGYPDLMISQSDAVGELYARWALSPDLAPVFRRKTLDAFLPGERPQSGLRGTAVADFDGDHRPDVFAAASTGARLYRNLGPVGPTQEFKFDDVAALAGLTPAQTDNSTVAGWGHYDRDGKIDLLIGRQGAYQAMVLLKNNTTTVADTLRGTFQDVTIASGIHLGPGNNLDIRTIAWANFTSDNIQDVFVGDVSSTSGGDSRLYVRQAGTTFQRLTGSGPDGMDYVTGSAWVSLDDDQDLDLVVAMDPPGGAGPHLAVCYNTGGVLSAPVPIDAGLTGANGLQLFDENLDGTADILVLPSAATESPKLLANVRTASGRVFADATAVAELDASPGRVQGAVALDFDRVDGRVDLYLGRQRGPGKYYYRNELEVGQGPDPVHFTIALEGGGGGNDPLGSGAVATLLRDGQPVSTQMVDGGGAQGGQQAGTLTFGSESASGLFELLTTWPDGSVQRDTVEVNSESTVQDQSNPVINPASMAGSYTAEGSALACWQMQWRSEKPGRDVFDEVVVTSSCLSEPLVLSLADPNVELTLTWDGAAWVHDLLAHNQPCIPNCVYTWYCRSSTAFQTSTTQSTPKTFKTKTCAQ